MNDELVAGGPLTVSSCFDLYKFHKQQKGKWTESMERARKCICAGLGTVAPHQITLPICDAYIDGRQKLGFARDTIRIEMAYLKAALRHVHGLGRMSVLPPLRVPGGGDARERWLTPDEVDKLISNAVELHVKLFIILSVTTAARPSHILQLTWDRVDLGNLIIDFRDKTRDPNNKQRPRVPINETCLKHLIVAKEIRRTEFVVEFRGKGFDSAKKGIYAAAKRAGLKGVSPYVLRHTAGVWMAKARVPMQEIAAYMGHKDLKTTIKHYAHHHPDFLRGAASALEIRPSVDPKLQGPSRTDGVNT
jgi:integrase